MSLFIILSTYQANPKTSALCYFFAKIDEALVSTRDMIIGFNKYT